MNLRRSFTHRRKSREESVRWERVRTNQRAERQTGGGWEMAQSVEHWEDKYEGLSVAPRTTVKSCV